MNYSNCFTLFYIISHFWLANNFKVVPRSHSESIQTPRGAQRWWERTSSTCHVFFFFIFTSNIFKCVQIFRVLSSRINIFSESSPIWLEIRSEFIVSSPYPPFLGKRQGSLNSWSAYFTILRFYWFTTLLFLDFIPWWNQILILMRSPIHPLYIYGYYWNH